MPSPIYGFWLKVNGVDVSTSVGFYPTALQGQWDAPAMSYDEVQMPSADGASLTMDEPEIQPLDFVATAELRGSDAAAFETNLDSLKYMLRSANLTVSGGNQPDRYRNAKYVGPLTVLMQNVDAANKATVQFKLRCVNPIQYATTTTTAISGGASATDHACALGTFRSRPLITITGGTNPILTYKNYAGTTVRIMTLTGTGNWVIDCAAMTVTLGGVRHDELLAGDFIRLDPIDGDYLLNHFPTVRTSSGTITIAYAKAWL